MTHMQLDLSKFSEYPIHPRSDLVKKANPQLVQWCKDHRPNSNERLVEFTDNFMTYCVSVQTYIYQYLNGIPFVHLLKRSQNKERTVSFRTSMFVADTPYTPEATTTPLLKLVDCDSHSVNLKPRHIHLTLNIDLDTEKVIPYALLQIEDYLKTTLVDCVPEGGTLFIRSSNVRWAMTDIEEHRLEITLLCGVIENFLWDRDKATPEQFWMNTNGWIPTC